MHKVLEIENLGKRYGTSWAVKDLSFSVEKGQICGILGPNGSGKTTTLGVILGCLQPSEGSFSWFEKGKRDNLRMSVGSILERPYFYPHLSAEQNLKLVGALRGQKNPPIDQTLERFNLLSAKSQKVSEYSLGMLQRLGLVAAFLNKPEVLVLDEPTNGLDAQGIALVREEILRFAKEGGSVLFASHILDEVEKICSHVVILQKGKLLQAGSIDVVLSQDQWLNLECDQPHSLVTSLENCPHIKSLKSHSPQHVQVSLKDGAKASDLNRFCIEKGISLSHLSSHRSSLESHFLSLVQSQKQGNTP